MAGVDSSREVVVTCSMGELLAYFLRLGAVGFGGPIALVGAMQNDLVEQRSWVSSAAYKEGLALAQLAPGPLAAQLAMYLGWVRGGAAGAALVGLAFVLPSFFMVLLLSALYLRFGGMNWIQHAFYGIGAAVIALIGRGAFKLARSTVGRDPRLWGIAVVNMAMTAWFETEKVWVFIVSGVVVLLLKASPRVARRGGMAALLPAGLLAGLHGPAPSETLVRIAAYFCEAGAFVFGSGLAIVPFLYGGVVQRFHWLNEQQFLDAVAVAMVTPGPVVITVAFIGYLVAGPVGATVAAAATFAPCYLFTVIPAPFFRRLAKNPQIHAFVEGVTAAAAGAIGGAGIVLAKRALTDLTTVALCACTFLMLTAFKKVPEPLVIVAFGAIGLLLRAGT
jgi:chromate transporter